MADGSTEEVTLADISRADSYQIDRLLSKHKNDCDRLLEAKRRLANGESIEVILSAITAKGGQISELDKPTNTKESINPSVKPNRPKTDKSDHSKGDSSMNRTAKAVKQYSDGKDRSNNKVSRVALQDNNSKHVSFVLEDDGLSFNNIANEDEYDYADDGVLESNSSDVFVEQQCIGNEDFDEISEPKNIWAKPAPKKIQGLSLQLEVSTLQRLLEKTEALRLPPVNGAETSSSLSQGLRKLKSKHSKVNKSNEFQTPNNSKETFPEYTKRPHSNS